MSQMVVEVVGMKAFKDTIDGKPVDSGVLFSMVRLDDRYNAAGRNFKCGHAVEEWKVGSAEVIFRMAHLKPSLSNPVLVRLEIERLSNGKETKEVVMDAIPVPPAPQAGAARPAAAPAATQPSKVAVPA